MSQGFKVTDTLTLIDATYIKATADHQVVMQASMAHRGTQIPLLSRPRWLGGSNPQGLHLVTQVVAAGSNPTASTQGIHMVAVGSNPPQASLISTFSPHSVAQVVAVGLQPSSQLPYTSVSSHR